MVLTHLILNDMMKVRPPAAPAVALALGGAACMGCFTAAWLQ